MITRCIVLMLLYASCAWGQSLTGKENGLKAFYHFDGNATDTVSGAASSITGSPQWTNATVGEYSLGVNLNSGQCVTTSDGLINLSDGMSVGAWVWIKSNVERAGLILSRANIIRGMSLGLGTGQGHRMSFYLNATTATGWQGFLLTNSVWTHIGFSYDGKTGFCKGYANGIQISEEKLYPLVLTNSGPFVIGLDSFNANRTFNGYVDEPFIFDRAISSAEFRALAANKPLPLAGGNRYKQANRYQINR